LIFDVLTIAVLYLRVQNPRSRRVLCKIVQDEIILNEMAHAEFIRCEVIPVEPVWAEILRCEIIPAHLVRCEYSRTEIA